MEQMSLGIEIKNNADRLRTEIFRILTAEDDYLSLLEINAIGTEKKGYGKTDVSIKAINNVIAQITRKKNLYTLKIKSKYNSAFKDIMFVQGENAYESFASFDTFGQIMDLADELTDYILLAISDMGGAGFGCCNRFIECSDAKECIHPDKKFALQCAYRKNLLAGRIFYGKNCNV